MLVNSLLTHEVSAIGRKLVGILGSSLAVCFPISFIDAVFHCAGTADCTQHELNRSWSATTSAGQFLNTLYGTPSKGQGVDLALDFLIAADISWVVISNSIFGMIGGGDIQSWRKKDFGSALYVSVKWRTASSSENWGSVSCWRFLRASFLLSLHYSGLLLALVVYYAS